MKQKRFEEHKKGNKLYSTYLKRVEKAKEVIERKPSTISWGVADYRIVNMSLKRNKEDGAVGKKLNELKEQYSKWRMRVPLTKDYFVDDLDVLVTGNDNNDGVEDDELPKFENVHTEMTPV